MQYGVDVGKERVDDWDKLLLREVVARVARDQSVSVLEVGCGAGAQAVRLAKTGASVLAIDVADYEAEVAERARLAGVEELVSWQEIGVCDFVKTLDDESYFTFVSMQRVLHYLSYADARVVLEKLFKITTDALYLSVTGNATAIAVYHPCPDAPMCERLKTLAPLGQQLFSITAPICPYSQTELEHLLLETGWQIKKMRTSDFGNVKVVAISK